MGNAGDTADVVLTGLSIKQNPQSSLSEAETRQRENAVDSEMRLIWSTTTQPICVRVCVGIIVYASRVHEVIIMVTLMSEQHFNVVAENFNFVCC